MPTASKRPRLVAVPVEIPAPRGPAAAVVLARVVAREGERFRLRLAGEERLAACDPSVDPALVAEAIASGARVVVEDGPEPLVVGALATARAVEVSREGEVRADVRRFVVTAEEEATLRTASAFLQVKGDEVELYARRLLSRARELARILARAIQLN
jgi:hypothetical protein